MIISHRYKFLFIGLPFSASSAITKDLHEEHDGKPYLRKHSLYHEFVKVATDEEKKYFADDHVFKTVSFADVSLHWN